MQNKIGRRFSISKFKSRMDIDFQDKYGTVCMRHFGGYQNEIS